MSRVKFGPLHPFFWWSFDALEIWLVTACQVSGIEMNAHSTDLESDLEKKQQRSSLNFKTLPLNLVFCLRTKVRTGPKPFYHIFQNGVWMDYGKR